MNLCVSCCELYSCLHTPADSKQSCVSGGGVLRLRWPHSPLPPHRCLLRKVWKPLRPKAHHTHNNSLHTVHAKYGRGGEGVREQTHFLYVPAFSYRNGVLSPFVLVHTVSVADPGCLFQIPDPNFSLPDPGSKKSQSSRKYDLGCSSRSGFFSLPVSRGQKSTGSGSATLHTEPVYLQFYFLCILNILP
jgi:hypothetical protein